MSESMTMASAIRTTAACPRAGSHVGLVLAYRRDGKSPDEIAALTGLTRTQTMRALRDLVERGYLAPTGPAQPRERRCAASSFWRCVWTEIAPYATLRMAPAEIHLALRREHGRMIPPAEIDTALRAATRTGQLAPRTEAERRAARGAAFASSTQRASLVERWLAVRDLLADHGLAGAPRTRLDWQRLIALWTSRQADAGGRTPARPGAQARGERALCRLAQELAARPHGADEPSVAPWSVIGPYAALRLAPREIAWALGTISAISLAPGAIARELHNARRRGRLPLPTLDERRDVRVRVSLARDSELGRRVAQRLDAAAIVLATTAWRWPTTRQEWDTLVDELEDAGVLTARAHHWRLLAALHSRWREPLAVLTDAAAVARTQRFLATASRAELDAMLGQRPDLVPKRQCDRWLLVTLSWAQQLATRYRDRTLLEALHRWWVHYDPSVSQRLRPLVKRLFAPEPVGSEPVGSAPVRLATRPSFDAPSEPAGLPGGEPAPPIGAGPLLSGHQFGCRRCGSCGGTMMLDPMERRFVCLLCGRTPGVAG
jgi:hypothetical protein